MDKHRISIVVNLCEKISCVSVGKCCHASLLDLLLFCPGDMYNHDNDADEPEWVKTEREQFVEFRDKNRDGKMDKEETKDWILPSDYDHAEAEARHLVYESDQNKVNTEKVNMYLLTEGVNWNPIKYGMESDFISKKINFFCFYRHSQI